MKTVAHLRTARVQGFSSLELLAAVAVLAILASVAINMVLTSQQTILTGKLAADVRTLNTQVGVYLSEGGSLAGADDVQTVLSRLKTRRTTALAHQQTSAATGTFVDMRLSTRLMTDDEAESTQYRVVWDSVNQIFSMTNQSGKAGVAEFILDDSLAASGNTYETRSNTSTVYNSNNGWVWANDGNGGPDKLTPTVVTLVDSSVATSVFDPTSTPPSTDPGGSSSSSGPTALPTPVITPVGGSFSAPTFPNTVSIDSNGAPGASDLQYKIIPASGTSTGWHDYAGPVAISYGDTVVATNISLDPTQYTNSGSVSQTYLLTSSTLPAPIITPVGGNFTLASFPSTVSISQNGAPGGTWSVLKYNVTHSNGVSTGWQIYTAGVALSYGDTISAQNVSLSAAAFTDSSVVTQTYTVNSLFTGTITPTWTNPVGSGNLVDTINNSNPASILFTHGSPSSSSSPGNISVADPSFETPGNTTVKGPLLLGTKTGTIGSWNYGIATVLGLGGASVSFASGTHPGPIDGNQVAELSEPGLIGAISTIDLNQTLTGVTLAANTTYTLSFDAAESTDLAKVLSYAAASITVGGVAVASLSNATLLSLLVYPNTMTPISLSFTTGATAPTGALGVDFTMTNIVNALPATLFLDNVQVYSGSPNSMTFNRGTLSTSSDSTFTLGQLLVYDGVTFNNTAASGVTLHMVLNMSSPSTQTVPVDLNFSITNPGSGVSGTETATLLNPNTGATININGVTYTLNVSLSSTDASNGSVSGTTMTIYGGKTLNVQVNGVWVRN